MRTFSTLVIFLFLSGQNVSARQLTDTLPSFIKGNFLDDYGIKYSVLDTLWRQLPRAQYHIIESDPAAQYIIARNGTGNSTEPGLFSRIDYMRFNNMGPYEWGFCYTVYKASSAAEARTATPADRENPRKGCNGFPFSRMKTDTADK